MKKILSFFLALWLALAAPLCAQPAPVNPYDLLGRALTPIASVFSPQAKNHALSATLFVEEMTGLPPELTGVRVDLALQPPDRLLIRFPYNGQIFTVCRAGNSVWIMPNTPLFDLVTQFLVPGELPRKKKKNSGLGPMTLPFSPQQLMLLPVLFQVKDIGDGQGLRKIETRLMPELARNLGVEEWSAQLTLTPSGAPVRIRLLGPDWTLNARVESLDYAKELPPSTWEPTGDALRLNAEQIHRAREAIGRVMENQRPSREE